MDIKTQKINLLSFKGLPIGVRRCNSQILAGGKLSYGDLKKLKKEGVTQVLDLRSPSTWLPQLKESIYCFLLGIKRKHLCVKLFNKLPDMSEFKEAQNFVDKPQKQTLIHCNCGLHRTNLFCEAIQILKKEKTLDDSLCSLKVNGFFSLNPKTKKSKEVQNAKLATLAKRLDEFKQLFSNFK